MTRRTSAWNLKGVSQVAAENLLEIVAVLHMKWLIESQGVAQLFDLTASGAFAKHLLNGIARDDMDQQKDHRHDQPDHRKHEQKAGEEVAGH